MNLTINDKWLSYLKPNIPNLNLELDKSLTSRFISSYNKVLASHTKSVNVNDFLLNTNVETLNVLHSVFLNQRQSLPKAGQCHLCLDMYSGL